MALTSRQPFAQGPAFQLHLASVEPHCRRRSSVSSVSQRRPPAAFSARHLQFRTSPSFPSAAARSRRVALHVHPNPRPPRSERASGTSSTTTSSLTATHTTKLTSPSNWHRTARSESSSVPPRKRQMSRSVGRIYERLCAESLETLVSSPTVAVLITSYNQAGYLAEALDSVMSQTYSPQQVIVADDASTDESGDVIRDYERRFPGIVVGVHNPKNPGSDESELRTPTSRFGLRFLLDGDDLFLPGNIQRMVRALGRSEVGVFGNVDIVDSNSYIEHEIVSHNPKVGSFSSSREIQVPTQHAYRSGTSPRSRHARSQSHATTATI